MACDDCGEIDRLIEQWRSESITRAGAQYFFSVEQFLFCGPFGSPPLPPARYTAITEALATKSKAKVTNKQSTTKNRNRKRNQNF